MIEILINFIIESFIYHLFMTLVTFIWTYYDQCSLKQNKIEY